MNGADDGSFLRRTVADLRKLRSLDIPTVRAGLWALRARSGVRRRLSSTGIDGAAEVSDPPALPSTAERGVAAALRRTRASCLERSLVLQRWYAAHGQRRDLIIGVTGPGDEFHAHAWLEGDHPCHEGEYAELLRRPAR